MANENRPIGLAPVKRLPSADWDGRGNVYHIPTTDSTNSYMPGDPVTLAGDADANGIPSIVKSTAGNGIVGVVLAVGTHPSGPWMNPADLSAIRAPASRAVDYYALVADDPYVLFEVQEAGGGTSLTSAAVGLNANLTIVANQTTGNYSSVVIDNGSEAATATLDVKLMGLVQRVGNAFGPYASWLVLINNHVYRAGVLGL